MSQDILQAEADRLTAKVTTYGQDLAWRQNEFAEILPLPKPLSLSILRGLANHDGATGMVCRELGLEYNQDVPVEEYLETVFGRTFVNSAAEKRLTGSGTSQSFLQKVISATKIRLEMATFYLRFQETVDNFDAFYDNHRTADLTALSGRDLLSRVELLVTTLNLHYQSVVKSGIFAKFSLDGLIALAGKKGLAPLLAINSEQLLSSNQVALKIIEYRKKKLATFFYYGAEVEYEFACPRFLEKKVTPPQESAKAMPLNTASVKNRKIKDHLFFFKIYESLKVIFKTMLLRELYLLRLTFLELDRRNGGKGDIFYLLLDELLSGEHLEIAASIEARKSTEKIFKQLDVPTTVLPSDLNMLVRGHLQKRKHELKGISINAIAFDGRALIYRSDKDIERMGPGRIIVTKQARPTLTLLFNHVRGIVAETGGPLSHLAIMAREEGFPLILQACDATVLINEGDHISVSTDGAISILPIHNGVSAHINSRN